MYKFWWFLTPEVPDKNKYMTNRHVFELTCIQDLNTNCIRNWNFKFSNGVKFSNDFELYFLNVVFKEQNTRYLATIFSIQGTECGYFIFLTYNFFWLNLHSISAFLGVYLCYESLLLNITFSPPLLHSKSNHNKCFSLLLCVLFQKVCF